MRIISFILSVGILFFFSSLIWGIYIPETNIQFQSSDGYWHDRELLFKDRNFDSVVVYFELYKLKCDKPNVTIQRVTKPPKSNEIAYWFNDYSEPKWKVKYFNKLPMPPFSKESCLWEGVNPETLMKARKKAQLYIKQLKRT